MTARTISPQSKHVVKVADEVWIAIALLQTEYPKRPDFEVAEIVERARQEAVHGRLRPGVYVHALQHCVANRPANPGRYRMLYATGKLTRRLFRQGDSFHPSREGAKMLPAREDIPTDYHYLLDWYFTDYATRKTNTQTTDPILGLRGLGKELWRGEQPDAYVRRLREGWE